MVAQSSGQHGKYMTPERWQQIKAVLDRALELAPGERSAFLDRACARDPSLRNEVEELLASGKEMRSSFMNTSPFAHQPLAEGTRLGDYEVQTLLGAGGMGRCTGRAIFGCAVTWPSKSCHRSFLPTPTVCGVSNRRRLRQ